METLRVEPSLALQKSTSYRAYQMNHKEWIIPDQIQEENVVIGRDIIGKPDNIFERISKRRVVVLSATTWKPQELLE